jgi:hypothetical protein
MSEEAEVVDVEAEVELVEAEGAADVQWAVVEVVELAEVMEHEVLVDEGGRSKGRLKRRRNAYPLSFHSPPPLYPFFSLPYYLSLSLSRLPFP